MRVTFQRSGGFAGLTLRCEISSEELSSDQVERLTQLIEAADFFNVPAKIPSNASAADQFVYTITVDRGDKRHVVQSGETTLPEKLRPLVDWLVKACRR